MRDFSGKTVLVTGGSRGIGRACVLAFARNGADVAINYHKNEEEAQKVLGEARALGVKSQVFRADTSKSNEVNSMIKDVVEYFGKINILVNNAGVLSRTPFLQLSESEWDWVLDINLKGYFLVGQAVAKQMVEQKSGGVIVNISSNNQERAAGNLVHYNVSKAGIAMLMKTMAFELAPYGIRVNNVAPGLTETDINRKDIANKEWREARMARIPLKVIATPDDITGAVLFLASDDAKLSTGQTVWVDAGATIS
ncbi:MAG TPA: SDR family NAD(P)-dependent oxidoreductase [Nitrososphaerales archaeon]|nr:SDR family NAD(P)-dependent oxidoreductase [Nitrososphaerales archaeon]